jgi:protocatechuate 3,4-dioxygenase beta subunit
VRQQYGQRGPNGIAATLTVVAGQRLTGVRMSMIRSSAISGRLIDTSGDVIADAQVHVWKVSYRDGWRMMIPVASVASNDLGEYRLFGLAPGQYLLNRPTRAEPIPFDRHPMPDCRLR